MQASFGSRLRQHRERHQIDLAAIAEQTKIKRSLLEALERDDLSRWPGGIFRRSWVRAYATAIGLDADKVIADLQVLYPDEPESVEAIASTLSPSSRGWTAWFRGRSAASVKPQSLVERLGDAARRTQAVGLMVWAWNPDASSLYPVGEYGYEQSLMSRLPDVRADADNAIAVAFRDREIAVVDGGEGATGALAVPIIAGGGDCTGVVAFELRDGDERRESVRFAARELAAALAGQQAPVSRTA